LRPAVPIALAAAALLAACADDRGSPFDPAADRDPPGLLRFEITTEDDHTYALWQADEPVRAVVEYVRAADGTVRHSYSGERGWAEAGLTKLLKLDAGATYDDVRVRLRDRAGNETSAAPADLASFSPQVVAVEDLFLFAMIDVGWGDALYLQAPDGTNCLVDAGHPADGPKVRWFLRSYLGLNPETDGIDFVSMTHVHEDHVGGFYGDEFEDLNGLFQINDTLRVDREIPVGTFLDILDKTPGTIGGPYGDLETALEGLGNKLGRHALLATGASSASDSALAWGRDVSVDLLAAGRKDYLLPEFILQAEIGSVQNNDSMIYRVQYGEFVLMLMGDGEFATEQFLQNRWPLDHLQADVLKLGHHGSNDANSERFLDVVDPIVAMIPNAVSENPGVEHPYVLGRLRKRGTDYFASDRVIPNRDRAESGVRGDVLLWTDGSAFTVVVDNVVYE
jgi:hypothetical protein